MNELTIKNKIYTIRGKQVMLDSDLAELYETKTKRLNEQVKRNIERFPQEFMFTLSNEEKVNLVAKCDHLKSLKYSYQNHYVFTEQGLAMLSTVLKSNTAITVSIQIMNAFAKMRKFLQNNANIFQRLANTEKTLLTHSNKIDEIFNLIQEKDIKPEKVIFFDGQVFEAHKFIKNLIIKSKNNIILIDNFIDEDVLTLFSQINVKVTIYTKNINEKLILALKKYNQQYNNIQIKEFNKSHDRFLIIDEKEIYHIGASLKDIGKKWFAFSKFESLEILNKLKNN
ncbi:MAG: ORF6N domain-containing protein [Candidatus Woesearchaeota archaeon]